VLYKYKPAKIGQQKPPELGASVYMAPPELGREAIVMSATVSSYTLLENRINNITFVKLLTYGS
jgi:hypothetical protein